MLYTGGFGHCLGLAAIIAEATTPFVNNRWFLDKAGMKVNCELKMMIFAIQMMDFVFKMMKFAFKWTGGSAVPHQWPVHDGIVVHRAGDGLPLAGLDCHCVARPDR